MGPAKLGIVDPEPVMLRFAAACIAGMLVVPVISHAGSPSGLAVTALATLALTCLLLSVIRRDPVIRPVLLMVAAASTGSAAYFFGPSSLFGGVLAIVLLVVGLFTARIEVADRTSRWLGWAIAGVVCAAQLVLVLLVVAGALADRSIMPVLAPGRPAWQAVVAHLALQSVYVGAFFLGRAVHRRYQRIIDETIAASRRALARTALLDEARKGHVRAHAIREQLDEDAVETDLATRPLRRSDAMLGPTRAPTEVVDARIDRWSNSFRANVAHQDLATAASVTLGVVLLATIVRAWTPRIMCIAALAVIASMVVVRRRQLRRNATSVASWPGIVGAAAAAGPAYAIGLHTGSVAPMAMLLFVGRLFRTPNATTSPRQNLPFVAIACLAHLAIFVAVMTGALADAGMYPIVQPGSEPYEPYVFHTIVIAIFVTAYRLGRHVDRRLTERYEAARLAYIADLRSGEELRRIHADLVTLGEQGLFSDTEIGPYRVGRLLGRGSMGEVYRAENADRTVALKLVQIRHMGDPAVLERFEREVAMLMRIDSPYCARVLDAKARLDLPYLVMEYVDGTSLSARLRERELTAGEISTLVSDVTRGLDDIHAAGVLHLDLKPSNIVFGQSARGKRWQIVDFGVARLVEEHEISMPGTPRFMAPEQLAGDSIDARADLYSAALIFFRVITGQAVTREPVAPSLPGTFSDDVALVLRIALARDPAQRFASATALRDAMLDALSGRCEERVRKRGRELLEQQPWSEA